MGPSYHNRSFRQVLVRAKTAYNEIILIRNRLRWMGHVGRRPGERPVKALLNGELVEGTRRAGRPLLRLSSNGHLDVRGCTLLMEKCSSKPAGAVGIGFGCVHQD